MSFKSMSLLKKVLWIITIGIMAGMFLFFNDLTMGGLIMVTVMVILLLVVISKIK